MSERYTLDIISQLNQFKNKSLRKFKLKGEDTVGAWGSEPFQIKFSNNTWDKVQVKISLDGTDILSGNLADTEVCDKMWLVNPNSSLVLKAWPETNKGGAAFMFTDASNGVAAHTHGNASSLGIIAAAVYVEGRKEYAYTNYGSSNFGPVRLNDSSSNRRAKSKMLSKNISETKGGPDYLSDHLSFNGSDGAPAASAAAADGRGDIGGPLQSMDCERYSIREKKSLASVGAGSNVAQSIKYVQGLYEPVFTEAVSLKYMWWDDLQAQLKAAKMPLPGFPGDKVHPEHKIMSLGSTPKLDDTNTSMINSLARKLAEISRLV